jgi:hydrogenase maturation protease
MDRPVPRHLPLRPADFGIRVVAVHTWPICPIYGWTPDSLFVSIDGGRGLCAGRRKSEATMTQASPRILVLGVGNVLLRDEGFGIRVIEKLQKWYDFPGPVTVVDGGVLGVHLMGVIAGADHLIVVDIVRNQGRPGQLHRLAGAEIPGRIRAKNSLHQIDFLEALTLCQALDKVPETVIVGAEPEDMETMTIGLSPTLEASVDPVIEMVLAELAHLGWPAVKRTTAHVPGDTFPHYEN